LNEKGNKMLKPEKFEVRDVIRSYDFKPMVGREDCFVEGEVLAINSEIGYKAYKIMVTKDSWSDDEDPGRVGKVVYCPVRVMYNEYPGRIINLSRV
jgi:hypothetical protein